jgi:hypothetical protein
MHEIKQQCTDKELLYKLYVDDQCHNSVRDFSIFRKKFFLRNTFWRLLQNFLSNFKKKISPLNSSVLYLILTILPFLVLFIMLCS